MTSLAKARQGARCRLLLLILTLALPGCAGTATGTWPLCHDRLEPINVPASSAARSTHE